MGAWGYGIREDDFVLDVIGVFEELLKTGHSVRDATTTVKSRFAAESNDSDDGPLLWLALADVQWTYGELESQVLHRVRDDFDSGRSLDAWRDDTRGLLRRRTALEKFISKIAVPNPRAKKPPKTVVRAPKFQPGDCLSVRVANGQYAAALVLAADHTTLEYGKNLVGVLDYLSPHKPPMEVFRTRKWLVRTHPGGSNAMVDVAWYYPVGFRAAKNRFEVVGHVEVSDSDPKDSNTYRGWRGIGEQVMPQARPNQL